MTAPIDVRSLRKDFGAVHAVDDVTFSVNAGEVLGFLGPNGAGKTTTMRMLTGYMPITAGEVRICGHDIQREPIKGKRMIGYLPEGAPLYGDMTPAGLLGFVSSVRGLSAADRRRRMAFVEEALELAPVLFQRIDTLSKGYKRRVGLAQAVLHDPTVLILDEPTDGLDPNQKHQVRDLIRTMGSEKAIIISTHLLEEVDAVCDRAIVIDRGRLVFSGTPAEFYARSPYHNSVVIEVGVTQRDKAVAALEGLAGAASVETRPGPGQRATIVVRSADGKSLAMPVGEALQGAGINILEMRTDAGRLDEVFRQITSSHEDTQSPA
jgi:ABC-2 type transport system ATP-binding protein